MIFYMMRCTAIDRWVGKKSPTYAIRTDERLIQLAGTSNQNFDPYQRDAYWWVDNQKQAKVWNSLEQVKRFISSAAGGKNNRPSNLSFSFYEVVGSDGSIAPLNSFF